jgi:hypothetical protein
MDSVEASKLNTDLITDHFFILFLDVTIKNFCVHNIRV